MDKVLQDLLKQEKDYRDNNNYYACFLTCLKILDEINSKNDNDKFDVISKIFLYTNQSNYVKLSLINSLNQNSLIISSNNIKKKYYQLLIDSFSKGKDKEYQKEINAIKKLYNKSNLNNFSELDNYISNFVSEVLNKSKIHTTIDTMNSSINGESSIINLSLKTPGLIDDSKTSNKGPGVLEEIITEANNENDLISVSKDSIKNNDKNKTTNQLKYLYKKYSPNNQLPMVLMSVSAYLNSNQFLNLINENFEKYNYKNIYTFKNTERDNIRIYEYQPNCICGLFSHIFCQKKNINQFHVYTTLKINDNSFSTGINTFLNDMYERKIAIKTIRGTQKNAMKGIIQFLKSYCVGVDKIQIIKQSKCFLKYNLDETLKKIVNNKKNKMHFKISSSSALNDENENRKKNTVVTLVEETNNEASQYYELYKIFSKKEYGLGKTISEFIKNFKKEYKYSDEDNNTINVNEIDTKKAMMKIINIFEESINTLNSTFNYDNENIKDKKTFFSNASEQFILNKIYPTLFNIYAIKYKKDNELYLQKKKEINEKFTIKEICNKIGIKSKLIGNEEIPFKYVIDIINKINFEKNLKKKYEAMTQASLELRNCILEYTNCKFELDSMDDELPIVIYIGTQINVDNLFAELNMIDDYIKCSLRDNLMQNKMVTNLLSSLLYISKEWKFD